MASFLTSKLGMVGTVISFTSVGGAIMNLWDMCDNGKSDLWRDILWRIDNHYYVYTTNFN